jgi:hypothetical protein
LVFRPELGAKHREQEALLFAGASFGSFDSVFIVDGADPFGSDYDLAGSERNRDSFLIAGLGVFVDAGEFKARWVWFA